MRGGFRVLLVVSAVVLVAGCGGDDGGGGGTSAGLSEGVFVGLVDDTDAYIAVVSDGEKLAGYVCDGKTVSIWFKGDISDGTATLRARTEQELGEVQLVEGTADGEIEMDGERRSFSAEPAIGEAGLYNAFKTDPQAGPVEVGWVVLNDGSQRGATNFVDPVANKRNVQPAPFVDPLVNDVSVNVGGNAITLAQMQVTQMFVDPLVNRR